MSIVETLSSKDTVRVGTGSPAVPGMRAVLATNFINILDTVEVELRLFGFLNEKSHFLIKAKAHFLTSSMAKFFHNNLNEGEGKGCYWR